MAHIIVTDEWLSEKMPLVDAAIIEELENQTDDEYQFSQQFEIKMKKMFIKKNRADNHCYFRTAVAAVCTLIVLSTAVIGVYAGGISFFETVKIALKDRFLYSYSTEKKSGEMEVRKPGYVPDGYEIFMEHASDILSDCIYRNKAGEELVFVQKIITDKDEIGIDSEYDWKEQIEVSYGLAEIHRYETGYVFCYLEYKDCVFILTAINLDNTEIKRIYEGWI